MENLGIKQYHPPPPPLTTTSISPKSLHPAPDALHQHKTASLCTGTRIFQKKVLNLAFEANSKRKAAIRLRKEGNEWKGDKKRSLPAEIGSYKKCQHPWASRFTELFDWLWKPESRQKWNHYDVNLVLKGPWHLTVCLIGTIIAIQKTGKWRLGHYVSWKGFRNSWISSKELKNKQNVVVVLWNKPYRNHTGRHKRGEINSRELGRINKK